MSPRPPLTGPTRTSAHGEAVEPRPAPP
jgi:hypothetical protein